MPQYKSQRLAVPSLFCLHSEVIVVNSHVEDGQSAVRRAYAFVRIQVSTVSKKEIPLLIEYILL
jgi:hypothetical protein